ncbi:hypothetical protein SAMN04487895_101113 [Paenibacillus sophorae]|uniref:NusG domain II-containing protein n=1 Tax=Paenibacillus sophorae TaxID=1333845 RepID=A0A1H8FHB7_9BACL|nr:NusG domain II-containing protein [Paenibacillus sophorae]QWU13867.1 NusG domain II-containing protein [Paenibacillus sophorae]SEN30894.1 hypothetical protein SAMN04487895_101113 [Paenibacillus sophorae]
MKRGDLYIILLGLLIAGSIYGIKWLHMDHSAYKPGDLMARITVNGNLYKNVALTKEVQIIDIKTEFGHNTLKAFDYGIQMIYSDAPKRIALDMGFISKPYQQIICIPTRVYVEVFNPHKQPSGDELDAVI